MTTGPSRNPEDKPADPSGDLEILRMALANTATCLGDALATYNRYVGDDVFKNSVPADHFKELLWKLYEGIYGHRKAEGIDPFKTAVGGALELAKAWRERGEPAERKAGELAVQITNLTTAITAMNSSAAIASESERKEIPPALLHSVREKWSAMGARYERAKSNWHNEMPGDWPVEVVMTMAELRALAVLPGSVPSSDVGTVKLLTDLLDRGYKMHVMAGTTTHLSAQDSDQNDPLLAWLSDVRSVLYGKTKPTPTVPTAGERNSEGKS